MLASSCLKRELGTANTKGKAQCNVHPNKSRYFYHKEGFKLNLSFNWSNRSDIRELKQRLFLSDVRQPEVDRTFLILGSGCALIFK